MIDIQFRRGVIRSWQKWFHRTPSTVDAARAVHYVQARECGHVRGFIRQPFLTPLVDLCRESDGLLQSYAKNTRYEIRRARAEGVSCGLEDDLARFVEFYNSFAATKDLSGLNLRELQHYASHLLVTKATREGNVLAMHSYLLDPQEKRARLLHSASLFRTTLTSEDSQRSGRANRLLHYQDMLHCRELGMGEMDLGGYHRSSDLALLSVNKFKESFGGNIVEESNYLSLPLYMYRLINQWLKRRQVSQARRAVG
jgi:lipid II:glycine glycyltransferase (peptidoglycan interpeptide bridge formation enzyme)